MHFTVLVPVNKFYTDYNDICYGIEDVLMPFSEHIEVARYKEYIPDEYVLQSAISIKARHEFEQEYGLTRDQIYNHANTDLYKQFKAYLEEYDSPFSELEVGSEEFYQAVGNVIVDEYGEPHGFDEKGVYEWVTSNPDGRWDWYQIGGRWSGFFIGKEGIQAFQGERSWANEDKEISDNKYDVIRVKDIDFDAMRDEAEQRVLEEFTPEYEQWLQQYPDTLDWHEFREAQKDKGIDREVMRKMYFDQPGMTEQEELVKEGKITNFVFNDALTTLGRDKQKLIEVRRRQVVTTNSVVTLDGEWKSVGWGAYGRGNEEEQWDDYVNNLYEELDPETWVALVDCHS